MKNRLVKKTEDKKISAGAELYSFLHALLERRATLASAAKEFSEIDTALKTYFKGSPALVIGEYKVLGEWKARTVCALPPSLAKKYARTERVWQTSIKKIKGASICNI